MLQWEPYIRSAKTFNSTDQAFRDVKYASAYDKGKVSYTPTPMFVAALTVLGICATILAYFIYA